MPVIIGPKEIVDTARERGALAAGHFLLSSGQHSEIFFGRKPLECDPYVYNKIGRAIVDRLPSRLKEKTIEVEDSLSSLVPVPSGGIKLADVIASHMVSRPRVHKTAKIEMDGEKTFEFCSHVNPGEKVAIVEDVATTGGSIEQVGNQLTDMGAMVVAVFELVNRKVDPGDINTNEHYLIRMQDAVNYDPNEYCPGCESGQELVKL